MTREPRHHDRFENSTRWDESMDWGDTIIRASAWGALTMSVASFVVRLRTPDRWRLARGLWTAGFGAFLIHLASAFHFVHHWSHASAVVETARRSEETIGLAFGGGVWVNYAFTILWAFDVAWWWVAADHHRHRGALIEWTVQLTLAFIWINATIVFGIGPIRVAGVAACLLLLFQWMFRRSTHQLDA